MSTLCPNPIAFCLCARHHVHRVSSHYCLLSQCQLSCPPCVYLFGACNYVNLQSPSKCPPSCQPCVPVLVLAIMLTVCPCLGSRHQLTLCPRHCACHRITLVTPPYCLLSQCQPSCQPCVPVLVLAIKSTFCPRLSARHHVNLVSPSWCPPSCQPCILVLVPAIIYTLCFLSWFPPSCQPCVPA